MDERKRVYKMYDSVAGWSWVGGPESAMKRGFDSHGWQ